MNRKCYILPAVKVGDLQAEELLLGISEQNGEDGPGIGEGSGGGDDALSKDDLPRVSIWDE